jgi:hypothetical protein
LAATDEGFPTMDLSMPLMDKKMGFAEEMGASILTP